MSSTSPAIEQAAELLKRVEQEAYNRGYREGRIAMRNELDQFIKSGLIERRPINPPPKESMPHDEGDERVTHEKRAPHGSAVALAIRALRAAGEAGLKSSDMLLYAANEDERRVSENTCRNVLSRLKSDGVCGNRYGRWFLAYKGGKTAEGESDAASTDNSVSSQEGDDGNKPLPVIRREYVVGRIYDQKSLKKNMGGAKSPVHTCASVAK